MECERLFWDGTDAKLWHDYIYDLTTAEAQIDFEAAVRFMDQHAL